MKRKDLESWRDKNERLNANVTLKRGDVVIDGLGGHGVVVKIVIPDNPSIENHGTVYVWQDSCVNYGGDNCEHYSWLNWKRYLRIVES